MHFTLDDIQQLTNPAAFKRGQTYFRQHKVLSAHLDQIHEQIVAEVQGNESYPYEVFLFWEDEELTSDCSCPVGYNCKHGVAVGLHWLHEQPEQALSAEQRAQPIALSTSLSTQLSAAKAKQVTKTPDTSLSQWLSLLPSKEVEAAPDFSLQPSQHHLLYQLKQHQGQHELYMYKAYLKVNGQWSQHSQYFPAHYMGWNAPMYFRPEDEEILRQLEPYTNNPVLAGAAGRKILDLLLLTRRLILKDQRPLQAAPPRALSWQWLAVNNEQRLTAKLEGITDWQVTAVTPPSYLDLTHGTIGEIDTPLTGPELAHLSTMPAVPNEQMAMTALQLRRVFTPEQLPLQAEPEFLREDTPIPHLTLTRAQGVNGQPLLGARVYFDYGPISLPAISRVASRFHGAATPSALPLSLLQEHAGRTYLIERDEHAEQHYIRQLCELDLWPRTLLDTQADKTPNFWAPASQDASMAVKQWQQLVEQDFPELARQGWRVSEAPDYHFEIHDAEFELSVQDGYNGWFDLSLGLQQGENTFDTMDVMAAWFKADMPEQLLLPVGDDWLRLDMQPLWTIRDLLFELFEKNLLNNPVSLPAFQAAQLQHLDLEDRHAPLTRAMMTQLQDFSGLQPVAVPVGLNAELRPYQQQGLDWLVFLHRYGLGGILADDMGLGKTIQTLALILHLKETKQLPQPAMILALTSLVGNWQHEARRFAPDLKVLIIHGPQRHGAFAEIGDHDLVITTYPLLLRDSEQYAQQQFSLLVLDEAQAIKNPITKVAQAVRTLKGGLRLCLSGTPLENHLGELWALFGLVLPGLLAGRSRFNNSYRQPIENEDNRQR